jgi:hypothetical protein
MSKGVVSRRDSGLLDDAYRSQWTGAAAVPGVEVSARQRQEPEAIIPTPTPMTLSSDLAAP